MFPAIKNAMSLSFREASIPRLSLQVPMANPMSLCMTVGTPSPEIKAPIDIATPRYWKGRTSFAIFPFLS